MVTDENFGKKQGEPFCERFPGSIWKISRKTQLYQKLVSSIDLRIPDEAYFKGMHFRPERLEPKNLNAAGPWGLYRFTGFGHFYI